MFDDHRRLDQRVNLSSAKRLCLRINAKNAKGDREIFARLLSKGDATGGSLGTSSDALLDLVFRGLRGDHEA